MTEQEDSLAEGARVPSDRRRVLLVDDEQRIRVLFRTILAAELHGVCIDMAGNGAEAVESFTRGHHAVLLMDLRMPVMDGSTAFDRIIASCASRHWEEPTVVFCTGFVPPDSVIRTVHESSRHCLLLKPVKVDVLVAAVRKGLSG